MVTEPRDEFSGFCHRQCDQTNGATLHMHATIDAMKVQTFEGLEALLTLEGFISLWIFVINFCIDTLQKKYG